MASSSFHAVVDTTDGQTRIRKIPEEPASRTEWKVKQKSLRLQLQATREAIKQSEPEAPKRFKRKDWAKEADIYVHYQERHDSGRGFTIQAKLTDPIESIKKKACEEFGIDPDREPERAQRVHHSHLARARWMTEHGYRQLVREGHH